MTAVTSGLNRLMSGPARVAKFAGAGRHGICQFKSGKIIISEQAAMGGHLSRANLLEGRLPDEHNGANDKAYLRLAPATSNRSK